MEKARVQVLVATMHQTDFSLLDRMNIQTDAIVVNQCDRNEIKIFEYKGRTIKWFSLNERGVGLSRNTALMRADGDILLFADDDVVYADNYEDTVINVFKENPKKGLIIFNLESLNEERPEYVVKKDYKLHWYNCLRFGAFRIAVKRDTVIYKNITYSLLFGGGARYQAGEDNLFITDCLKRKIKGLACSKHIGTVRQEASTWFNGYNDKYYFDRGALFAAMYPHMYRVMLLLIGIRDSIKGTQMKFSDKYRLEASGAKEYKKTGNCNER